MVIIITRFNAKHEPLFIGQCYLPPPGRESCRIPPPYATYIVKSD